MSQILGEIRNPLFITTYLLFCQRRAEVDARDGHIRRQRKYGIK